MCRGVRHAQHLGDGSAQRTDDDNVVLCQTNAAHMQTSRQQNRRAAVAPRDASQAHRLEHTKSDQASTACLQRAHS